MDLDQVSRGTWSLEMDKPADPETPFAQVYQAFLDDLALEGTKTSTIRRYRYDIVRFGKWLAGTGRAVTLASLERTTLFTYHDEADRALLREFLEVRQIIEPEAAALTASRATHAELDRLGHDVDRLAEAVNVGYRPPEDLGFH